MELQRRAGWSGFGSRERKSRAGEGKSGIKEGGRVAFFILRDLDCCNSGFSDAAFSTSGPRGKSREREGTRDGWASRKKECEHEQGLMCNSSGMESLGPERENGIKVESKDAA